MSRGRRFIGSVLAAVVAGSAVVHAAGSALTVSVEPRIVGATLERVSLERLDFSLRIALTASQSATIRQIAFTEAFVGSVPVWIAPVDGEWPLRAKQELVIPKAMQVRVFTRDTVGADDFSAIARDGQVAVRASVEVDVDTPWLGRLFLMGPRQTVVRDVTLSMPMQIGPSALQPLAKLTAGLADAAQRGAAAWLAPGMNRLPQRKAALDRFGHAVAAVTTRYVIEHDGGSGRRERTGAGFWWSPSVLCTTRETIEPWRFDPADAMQLQLTGGRLRLDQAALRIDATPAHAALTLDPAALAAGLSEPQERRVYALVGGRLQKMRLADRHADSNLVCLQVGDAPADGGRRDTADTPAAPGDVAAFAPGAPASVVWTKARASRTGDRLLLETPLVKALIGSPIVSGATVIGLVGSSTTAWPASAVAIAAARAPRVAGVPSARSSAAAGAAK
jgi:hypothetical protein